MELTVEQLLFDELLVIAQDLGIKAYPHSPSANTPYPFVEIIDV